MIKTNFTITFFESEICFKINAKFILITNTHPVTFLDLRFLVVLKTQAKKVLSAGIFNGCLRFFLPDEEQYCRMNDHPVECVLQPSLRQIVSRERKFICKIDLKVEHEICKLSDKFNVVERQQVWKPDSGRKFYIKFYLPSSDKVVL